MKDLLQSRRFLTAVIATVATLVIYFVSKYFSQSLADVQMILNLIMPLALALIAAYTVDDVVTSHDRAAVELEQTKLAMMQTQLATLQAQVNAPRTY